MHFCIFAKTSFMHNIMGPPVEGEDFYGRVKELGFAWQMIDNGNNIQLAAPRRVGKTSFALQLLSVAKEKSWQTISINLEKISTEYQFLELFIANLKQLSWWDKLKEKGSIFLEFFSQIKPSLSYKGVKVDLTWENRQQDVYKQLAELLDHSENTLIFFDEITVLLTNILNSGEDGKIRVKALLHWLRDIRITSGSRIRWVFCSSVGIENFTHKHRMSDTLNDVHNFPLRSFSQKDSIEMLVALAKSYRLPLAAPLSEKITIKLGYCIPFFLQILFGKINYLFSVEGIPLDAAL